MLEEAIQRRRFHPGLLRSEKAEVLILNLQLPLKDRFHEVIGDRLSLLIFPLIVARRRYRQGFRSYEARSSREDTLGIVLTYAKVTLAWPCYHESR
jgi:hypothetical protein